MRSLCPGIGQRQLRWRGSDLDRVVLHVLQRAVRNTCGNLELVHIRSTRGAQTCACEVGERSGLGSPRGSVPNWPAACVGGGTAGQQDITRE